MAKSSAAFWGSAIVLSLGILLLIGTVTGYVISQGLGPGGFNGPGIPGGNLILTCVIGNCSKCSSQIACEGAGCRWIPGGSSGGIGWMAYCDEPASSVEQPMPTITTEKGKANANVTFIVGSKVFSLKFGKVEGLSFRKMELDMKAVNPSNVMISAEKLPSRPDDVTTPQANAYEYVSVKTSGVTDNDINSVKITFAVSRDWLTDINDSSVSLIRWNSAALKWDSLITEKVSADAGEITYSATSPGFSTFAIVGYAATPSIITPIENKTQENVTPSENVTLPDKEKTDADSALANARIAINAAIADGKDTTDAENFLTEAENSYALGDYLTALTSAKSAKNAAENAIVIAGPQTGPDMTPIILLVLAVIFIAGGAAGLMIIKRKKKTMEMPALGGQ